MWPPYQKSGSRRLTVREPLWLSWLETFHMHCMYMPMWKITIAVFKKLTNAVVVDTDFINIALTKPSTKSRQRNNN